jgi:hypothetical protein
LLPASEGFVSVLDSIRREGAQETSQHKKKKKKDISCNIYMFGRGRGDEEQARAP